MAVVLALSLAACGSTSAGSTPAGTSGSGASGASSSSAQDSESAGADGKITISYWTTDRHDQAYLTPLIEKFNQTNDKNIYIDYQVYADNYSQMLELAFSTGTAPDVYKGGGTDALEVLVNDKKQVMDLSPFMDDAYRARFGDGAFVEGINAIGDGIYTLPRTASACRLFYNKDIFERVGIETPPATLDELVADAKQITEQLRGEGIYGISGNFKSAASSVARSIDMIVMRSGGTRGGFFVWLKPVPNLCLYIRLLFLCAELPLWASVKLAAFLLQSTQKNHIIFSVAQALFPPCLMGNKGESAHAALPLCAGSILWIPL